MGGRSAHGRASSAGGGGEVPGCSLRRGALDPVADPPAQAVPWAEALAAAGWRG